MAAFAIGLEGSPGDAKLLLLKGNNFDIGLEQERIQSLLRIFTVSARHHHGGFQDGYRRDQKLGRMFHQKGELRPFRLIQHNRQNRRSVKNQRVGTPNSS